MTREEQAQGPCRAFQALGVASPAHGWCKAKRRFVPAAECGQGCHLYEDPECPIFCDRGAMIRQNLPRDLGVGCHVDHRLPPGTLEVWQDGRRLGRITGIGDPT